MSQKDPAAPEQTPPARRVWGIVLLILSVFVALSVFSYDWRDVATLKSPPNMPPCNLIGPAGARLAFALFMLLGIAAYTVPAAMLMEGLILVRDRDRRVWPRLLWVLAGLCGVTLALELRPDWWFDACQRLNTSDAGGILGHLVSRRLLIRWLSPIGAGILILALIGISAVMAVRGRRVMAWLAAAAEAGRAALERARQAREERRATAEAQAEAEAVTKPRSAAAAAGASPDKAGPEEGELVSVPASPEPPPRRKIEKPAARKPEPPREPPPKPVEPEPEPIALASSAGGSGYQLPSINLLDPIPEATGDEVPPDTEAAGRTIVNTLADFNIEAQVVRAEVGPVVTCYEVLPAPGIKVERIAGLQNNLALSLKATTVRVVAPIPGKGVVGIEVPNATAKMVYLREILESDKWRRGNIRLPLALGKDVGGNDIVADLTRMPHMLIAGATGSGKTVCMNSILAGLLMSRTPDELKLLLVDPKIVEFAAFNDLPHLVVPVVTDPKKVAIALRWAITEMEKRFKLFARANVRNIDSYNDRVVATQGDLFEAEKAPKDADMPARVPYIVIVIDELADLMLAAGPDIENGIARLAQLSRAVGIHMIIATQRPSVNVITGTIKANFPARLAFQVAQKVDSRTILDQSGADTLLGRGDMLFLPPQTGKLVRGQGAMVKDSEIKLITEFIKQQARPSFIPQIQEELERPIPAGGEAGGEGDGDGDSDDLLPQAIAIIRETRRASTSSLQRRLSIGYNRAGRLMDRLEERGIVGPPRGSDPREILIDLDGDIPNNAGPDGMDADGSDGTPADGAPEDNGPRA